MNCHQVILDGLSLATCGPSSQLSSAADLNLLSLPFFKGLSLSLHFVDLCLSVAFS